MVYAAPQSVRYLVRHSQYILLQRPAVYHLIRLQILSQHVTQSNSEAVTENLHTHFSGWTMAVRQSIENFYEGLLVSIAHDIGRIVGAFKFT